METLRLKKVGLLALGVLASVAPVRAENPLGQGYAFAELEWLRARPEVNLTSDHGSFTERYHSKEYDSWNLELGSVIPLGQRFGAGASMAGQSWGFHTENELSGSLNGSANWDRPSTQVGAGLTLIFYSQPTGSHPWRAGAGVNPDGRPGFPVVSLTASYSYAETNTRVRNATGPYLYSGPAYRSDAHESALGLQVKLPIQRRLTVYVNPGTQLFYDYNTLQGTGPSYDESFSWYRYKAGIRAFLDLYGGDSTERPFHPNLGPPGQIRLDASYAADYYNGLNRPSTDYPPDLRLSLGGALGESSSLILGLDLRQNLDANTDWSRMAYSVECQYAFGGKDRFEVGRGD